MLLFMARQGQNGKIIIVKLSCFQIKNNNIFLGNSSIRDNKNICFALTCSTIEARRPRASPWLSSRVMTALPSLTTSRRAYLSWLRSVKVGCAFSRRRSGDTSWNKTINRWILSPSIEENRTEWGHKLRQQHSKP